MHPHLHLTSPLHHRRTRHHAHARLDTVQRATRAAATLLAAYGGTMIVWGFADDTAPALLVSLGLYALIGAVAALLAPRLSGIVLVLGAVAGVPIALAARWLGETYATTLTDAQLAALFAVPLAAGLLLLIGRRGA